ncbi:bifunctional diaminohydroxyphosphoribosylaminopyrimidine deaminase/5-amino-6-(5-phosphoribosylamino)uracil reductase RibD [Brevibacillus laterosporus]|uniref:bifunctional diaminohydroxyphosphoribosylaminopyrimidine deaminase/5-amino-6-(5-phosphoribosylamino)uracil reductase RibD n=1 Tax=Brevibacillus laterosporus TaxID=1465 RepID=UPI00215BBB5C|nr:bifunctional diaminohydroxyphosphoribosylaminopyrimidine deaminase/5-amino-6-(5-phosphoribosylamino)uracil reductase RibD [Brevibacillus laterosporus]MCR8939593.1 bifunctional diaminohydroxyphosphoribosylaminopyrimidine deaminase/5-amino-6-(5-phosphoribosylamino)uracil reductase RibD [Brevibacillus laterosporus]MCZ0842233.1 bifunctional diaminohydroxyphosphoribosylaminopyrimidine deaminase/5-amino-6-(5-phosphoribosylamino)uracil reductase RibD [Brevibacillus laterosporus]MCZ0846176.1 bifuncti
MSEYQKHERRECENQALLDQSFMKLAIQLAEGARHQTSPNPTVGAVIVKQGSIVGMGAHLRAGESHAEIHALRMAGEKAMGATVYVTLEPCSHYGKTPPCVQALLEAGVARVVIATVDSNPLVAGKGLAVLKNAGVDVQIGVLEKEARQCNESFFHYINTRRPFVTLKTASTLDGKLATTTGDSKWITSEIARREVHEERAKSDAILVGISTVIQDDPLLTARLYENGKQPIRVILDQTLRIPKTATILKDSTSLVWIFTTRRASQQKAAFLRAKGIRITVQQEDQLTIPFVLQTLGEAEIVSVLVEGGSKISGAFLEAKAIQKVIAYVAFTLVGGEQAPVAYGGFGIPFMKDAIRLRDVAVETVSEQELRITGYPLWTDPINS